MMRCTSLSVMKAKIDDLESQVEAYDLGKKTLADEFRALESENKVDAELEALKARLNKDTAKKRRQSIRCC